MRNVRRGGRGSDKGEGRTKDENKGGVPPAHATGGGGGRTIHLPLFDLIFRIRCLFRGKEDIPTGKGTSTVAVELEWPPTCEGCECQEKLSKGRRENSKEKGENKEKGEKKERGETKVVGKLEKKSSKAETVAKKAKKKLEARQRKDRAAPAGGSGARRHRGPVQAAAILAYAEREGNVLRLEGTKGSAMIEEEGIQDVESTPKPVVEHFGMALAVMQKRSSYKVLSITKQVSSAQLGEGSERIKKGKRSING